MYLGLDIGGYKINGLLMRGNKIVRKKLTPIKSKSDKKTIIAQIFDCIEYLIKGINLKEIKGIGIGVPGPIDFKKQKILNPPNVTALKNLFLAKIIQEKFPAQGWSASGGKIKTKIENDANCLGLAEALLGAGRNKKIVAGLTLGTGVGGFVVVDKKIFYGKSPRATEFGHKIKIIKNGRKCNCGHRGCLEAYASTRGIVKTAKERGLLSVRNPKQITEMAERGNKKAKEVFAETGEYLGIALKNIIKDFKPGIIIIGGGISGAGKFIFGPVRKIVKDTKIVKAELDENAGAIGAALLVKSYPQIIHNKG
jgi:glucokinase